MPKWLAAKSPRPLPEILHLASQVGGTEWGAGVCPWFHDEGSTRAPVGPLCSAGEFTLLQNKFGLVSVLSYFLQPCPSTSPPAHTMFWVYSLYIFGFYVRFYSKTNSTAEKNGKTLGWLPPALANNLRRCKKCLSKASGLPMIDTK